MYQMLNNKLNAIQSALEKVLLEPQKIEFPGAEVIEYCRKPIELVREGATTYSYDSDIPFQFLCVNGVILREGSGYEVDREAKKVRVTKNTGTIGDIFLF